MGEPELPQLAASFIAGPGGVRGVCSLYENSLRGHIYNSATLLHAQKLS